jgi:hypothetical protein
LLPPVLQRVDEPGLRKQLEEAAQKQRALEERVDQLLDEVRSLCDLELYDAAVGLIQSESAGMKQVKRVQAALESAMKLLESEAATLETIGSVYAALNGPECAGIFQRILAVEAASTPPGVVEIEQRLGTRVQSIADLELTRCIEAARQALGADDPALAESLMQGADAWQAVSSPTVQADWKTMQSELAAARKVLRFRKVLRR